MSGDRASDDRGERIAARNQFEHEYTGDHPGDAYSLSDDLDGWGWPYPRRIITTRDPEAAA